MGEKGVLKKGRGKGGRKRPPKFANSKTDGRLGGNSQILKAGGSSAIGASSTPCFTLIEQALSVFFNVNYI